MSQMLLLNPAKRRKSRKARSPAQKRATAKLVAMNRRRKSPRRASAYAANPAPARRRRATTSVVRRRRNPVTRIVSRRRRNPVSFGGGSSIVAMLKGAAIAGAGAVAMDVVIGQINKFLPASLLGNPNQIDQGDAVKAGLTVLIGKVLAKPTRGMSIKAAQASLAVQAYNLISQIVPASMPLGYSSPARIVNGQQRIGPNVRTGGQQVGRFVPGVTPLLSQYTQGNVTPLLNGSSNYNSRMAREGFNYR
jgi:hypothetical protein